jgi:hypothetical protein
VEELVPMTVERIVLATAWLVTIAAIILFMPREKLRMAWVAYLFFQAEQWLLTLGLVYLHAVEYPVREFPKATTTNFTLEYFVYPVIAAFYCCYYPDTRKQVVRFMYGLLFSGLLTSISCLLAKYTELIKYKNLDWNWLWLIFMTEMLICNAYTRWFCEKKQTWTGNSDAYG